MESKPKPSSKPAIRVLEGEHHRKASLLQTALTKPPKPPLLSHLMPDSLKPKSKIQPAFVIGKTTKTVPNSKPRTQSQASVVNQTPSSLTYSLPRTKIQPSLSSTVTSSRVLNLVPVAKPTLADLIASKTQSNMAKLTPFQNTRTMPSSASKTPSTVVGANKTQPKLIVVRKPETGFTQSEPRPGNARSSIVTVGHKSANNATSSGQKVIPEPRYKVLSLGPNFSTTQSKIIVINDPLDDTDRKIPNSYSLTKPAIQPEVVSSSSLRLEAKKPKTLSKKNPSLKSESLLFYKVLDENDVSKVLVTDDLSDFDFQDGKFRVEVKKHATSDHKDKLQNVRLIEKKKIELAEKGSESNLPCPPNLVLLRPTKSKARGDVTRHDPLLIAEDPLETPEPEAETVQEEIFIKEEQITFEN